MSNNLKNIFVDQDKNIEQDKLLQYLNHTLEHAEQHEVESQLINDEFTNEAVEGLQQMEDNTVVPRYIDQLNAELKKQLKKKRNKKSYRKLPAQYWIYISIILLLTLIIIAFIVVRKMT